MMLWLLLLAGLQTVGEDGWLGPTDVTLALKTGQYIDVSGPQKRDGAFLVFHRALDGELMTVKMNRIDMARTREINDGFLDPDWRPPVEEDDGPEAPPEESLALILKSGQVMRARGTYALIGDQIQFTLASTGEVMTLDLDRVDLEATRAHNPDFRDTRPLFRREARDREPLGDWVPRIGDDSDSGSAGPAGTSPPPSSGPADARIEELERMVQRVQNEGGIWLFLIPVMVLVIGLLSLLSLGVQVYVLVRGFQRGILWGMALLLGIMLPFMLYVGAILMQVTEPATLAGLGLTQMAISFFYLITFVVFVWIDCYGHRFKLYLAWASPALFGGFFLVVMALVLVI